VLRFGLIDVTYVRIPIWECSIIECPHLNSHFFEVMLHQNTSCVYHSSLSSCYLCPCYHQDYHVHTLFMYLLFDISCTRTHSSLAVYPFFSSCPGHLWNMQGHYVVVTTSLLSLHHERNYWALAMVIRNHSSTPIVHFDMHWNSKNWSHQNLMRTTMNTK